MSIIDESRQGVIAENSVGGSFEPLNGGYLVTLGCGYATHVEPDSRRARRNSVSHSAHPSSFSGNEEPTTKSDRLSETVHSIGQTHLEAFHNQLDRVADCLSDGAFDGKVELVAAHQRPTLVIGRAPW
jgi:hypothetical protein